MHTAKLRNVFSALCLMALVACQPKPTPMTPQETQHFEKLTSQMSTRCVGRYLVDMPEAFVLNSEAQAEIEGVKVDVRPMTRGMFEQAFQGRRKKLESMLQLGETWPHLRKTLPVPNSSLGAVFDRAESDGAGRLGRTLELMAWSNGFQLKGSIDATDTTFPEDANDSIAKQLKTDVAEKLAKLLSVYDRVRGRSNQEIPAEAGFCIANGFVKGPANEDEEAYVPFHLDGAPDVYFHFSVNKDDGKEQQSLLQRMGQVEREMKASGTQTVRKGKRQIHALDYEEWLMKGPTAYDVPGTMFTFVGNETQRGATHPFIRLELFNGFRIPAPELTSEESAQLKKLERATLSEAEAVAVWDKVTGTFRPRPGAL
jgi:hypothetical protein